jgi:hypothetical protein
MRAPLWLVPALLFATAAAAAETPSQAFARLPPLAGAATPGMDCPAAEATRKKVEAQIAPLRAMPMAPGGSAVQMSPAQMQAMAAMSDPAFNECVSALQMRPGDWEQALRDRLEAKLEQVNADYIKAIEAFCRKSNDENCRGSPALQRQFSAQAAAAGTQFLKDAQPGYAKLLKETGDCIASREKGMGAATGGGNAVLDAIFASNAGVTWGLLNLPAAANTRLCEAARDAAGRHSE